LQIVIYDMHIVLINPQLGVVFEIVKKTKVAALTLWEHNDN